MKKTMKNKIYVVLLALLMLISSFFSMGFTSARADSNTVKFDETNVMDDLRSSKNFNILSYPFYVSEKPEMYIMNVVEYCYSFDVQKQGNYGLYLYIYNPNGRNIDISEGVNKVEMAAGYDSDGTPNCYEKFDLKFCSKSEEEFYKGLFYKFKVVDHKSLDGKTILQRVKSSARRYDISGIEILEQGKTLPVEYGVGGTYTFKGYAEGYGALVTENSLTCEVKELETIQLEVHKTNFRTGEYQTNHRHDLTSVYFSVPQRFFDDYGSLQKIKAEWYEYETNPIAITSNTSLYNSLNEQIGKNATTNDMPISLYSGYQQLVGSNGHYNSYNFGYNVYGEVHDKIDTLYYVFSTNGADISKYTLSASRIQSYIENYNKTFVNGTINIPGKKISADLFSKDLDANRKSVAYVGNDIHHKLVNIDANDEFDMLNYQESNSGWKRFFAGLFGLGPSEVSQSYTGISPIHIVTDEERNGANISTTLLIDNSDSALSEFTNFYDTEKAKGNKTVLFRFAQTDYEAIPVIAYNEHTGTNISKQYGKDTFVVRESVFLNFDIIELTFSKEGKYTVIPVVSSPIDIYNDITLPEVEDPWAWLETLLAIVLLVLLFVFLWVTGLLPFVLKAIGWIILLPFRIIAWIVNAITKTVKNRNDKEK